MAYYDEQDDPEMAAEPSWLPPDQTPEELAALDAHHAEGNRIATELMVAEWEANPPVTRCAWCCREMDPQPDGNPYPTCGECLRGETT
jgi:hypothetical protein